MSSNLNEFRKLRSEGWQLQEVSFQAKARYAISPGKVLDIIIPMKTASAIVKLTKGYETRVIHAENDSVFCSHIMHYKQLPHPKSGQIELQYVEDINKYYDFQEKLFSFICGIKPYFPVFTKKRSLSIQDQKKIQTAIETWIESESILRLFPTKMPRLFHDVLVLRKNKGDFDCFTLEKERTSLSDILRILKESSETEWTKCYTVVFLCPKTTRDLSRDFILMTILYDAKTRQVDAACIGTLRSILNYAGIRYAKGRGLVEATSQLTHKMLDIDASTVYVVAPFRDSEFTPVPWIAYLLLADLRYEFDSVEEELAIYPHEAFVFGDTGIHIKRGSLDFKRRAQSAAVIVELDSKYRYVARYDRSVPEPKFHVHYEIRERSTGEIKFKLLDHHPVLFQDLWNLGENLYIAFLSAGAFDVKFSELITADIKDFDTIMNKQPLAAYPLIYRGFVEQEENWLRDNPEALKLLRKFWEYPSYSPSQDELTLTKVLEDRRLIEGGGLSCQAIVVLSRLLVLK